MPDTQYLVLDIRYPVFRYEVLDIGYWVSDI